MKKLLLALSIVMLVILLTACNPNSAIAGEWYGDRNASDTLTLDKDGSYTAETFISGTYTYKNGVITLTDVWYGSRTLDVKGDNLISESGYTYYRTAKAANDAREARIAAEKEAATLKELEDTNSLSDKLIGSWYNDVIEKEIEFTSHGEIITYLANEKTSASYEVVDGSHITTEDITYYCEIQDDGSLKMYIPNGIFAQNLTIYQRK